MKNEYGFIVKDAAGKLVVEKSYRFDSYKTGLEEATIDDVRIPWMLAELDVPEVLDQGLSWSIVIQDDIPAEVVRWNCLTEGCEAEAHCPRCGHHFSKYESEGRNLCPDCQISDISEVTQQQVAACGGDSNKAARVYGW